LPKKLIKPIAVSTPIIPANVVRRIPLNGCERASRGIIPTLFQNIPIITNKGIKDMVKYPTIPVYS